MLLTADLMPSGVQTLSLSHHIPFINLAQHLANLPFVPKTFVLFIYLSQRPDRKYLVKGSVFDKHCRQLFMKHVLPRFLKPTKPLALLVVNFIYTGLLSSQYSAKEQIRRWNRLSLSLHYCEQQATFQHWHGNFSSAISQHPQHFFQFSACKNQRFDFYLIQTKKKSPSYICRSYILDAESSLFPKPLMRYSQLALSAAVFRYLNKESRFYFLSILQRRASKDQAYYSCQMIFSIRSFTTAFQDSWMIFNEKSYLFLLFWSMNFRSALLITMYWQSLRYMGILFSSPNFTALLFNSLQWKSLSKSYVAWLNNSKSSFYLSPYRNF